MGRFDDMIVMITGATSGIGAACAYAFAEHGARIVACARRMERLGELRKLIGVDRAYVIELDVRDRRTVHEAVDELPDAWRSIDVLVNNAGLSRGLDAVQDGSETDWDEMIDTNIRGLLHITRAVLPGMIERGRGHVINIGSIAGHEVYPKGNVYCATKFAVGALTKGMQLDLLGTGVRATTVDPGMVETEFSVVRFHGDVERAAAVYEGLTPLSANDVADAVLYCASRPAHVNVHEIVLMPSAQASATMAHRHS